MSAHLKEARENFECVYSLETVLPNDMSHSNELMFRTAKVFMNEASSFMSKETEKLNVQIQVPLATISAIVRSEEMRGKSCYKL